LEGIKHLFYLKGIEDLGLHYFQFVDPKLVGYANAGYKSNPATIKSQSSSIFLQHGVAIS